MRYLVRIYDNIAYTYYVEKIVFVEDITQIPQKLENDPDFMENIRLTFSQVKDFPYIWENYKREIIPLN